MIERASVRLLLWASVLLVPMNGLATLLWIIGAVKSIAIVVLGIVGTVVFLGYSSLLGVNIRSSLPLSEGATYKLLRNFIFPLLACFLGFAAGVILGAVCGSFWYYSVDGVVTVDDTFANKVLNGVEPVNGNHPYGFVFEKDYEIVLDPGLWANATFRSENSWFLICVAPLSLNPGTKLQNRTEPVAFYVSCFKEKGTSCWKDRNECIEEWWAPPKQDSSRLYNSEKFWAENLKAIDVGGLPKAGRPIVLSNQAINTTISKARAALIAVYFLFNLLYILVIGGILGFIFAMDTCGMCPRTAKGAASEIETNQRTAETNLTSGTVDTQTNT